MKLSKSLTKVTPLSKALAMTWFIILPFIGFYLGIKYQKIIDSQIISLSEVNTSFVGIITPTPVNYQMKGVTIERAINIVRQQKEVSEWLSLFSGPGQTSPKTGGKPAIVFDHTENSYYIIHVFESMPDHIATFNWYKVDMKSGMSYKEFNY